MSTPELIVKRLTDNATIPTRGSEFAAGYDLYAARNVDIPAMGKAIIQTDLAMAIPEGCYGRIAPRSGFSWKKHTDVGAGVIDRDYRGNVGVVIFNHSSSEIKVEKGDRIAQLILERNITPHVVECLEELPETSRGEGGFGSTGC